MKQCNKCKRWKDESEYGRDVRRRDGLTGTCRKCENKRYREFYRRSRKYVKKYYSYEQSHRVVEGVKEKRCRKCKSWKPESEFYSHRRNKDGLDVWCRECVRKV